MMVEKVVATHSSVLAWRKPGTREPGGLPSMGSHRSDLASANSVGGNEGDGDLLQKVPCTHCYTHCPQPCSRPAPTPASAGDSWTLLGKSGSVSCGVTGPFSWKGVHGAKVERKLVDEF